jgi:iron-sulfur cluster assembly accessory protein
MAFLQIKSKHASQNANASLPHVAADAVGLTMSAAEHVQALLVSESKKEGILRFGVVGGGCSGLSYHFAVEDSPRDSDLVFEGHGVRVCVDPRSMNVVGGSTIDFDESVQRRRFIVHSPRAKKSCSCGSSFTL